MSTGVEAWRLYRDWEAARERLEREDFPEADQEEQEAYDRLVDYIEANGLNYSQYDPRGQEEDEQ